MKLTHLKYALLLGAVTGAVFAFSLWGYELILLVRAHVAYAWLPGLIGLLLCAIICTAAALLTHLTHKALLGIVFWVLAAIGVAQLLIYIPFRLAPGVMRVFEPGLKSHLPAYTLFDNFRFWAGTASVWLAIFFGILGLLQNTLVEGAVPAMRPVGRMAPFLIMVPVMIIASVMAGNMINEQLRDPLISENELIQFAIDHQNETVSPEVARNIHLSSLDQVSDLLNRRYRLFMGTYDRNFGQVNVLVDFSGKWADCTVIYSQPVDCERISP